MLIQCVYALSQPHSRVRCVNQIDHVDGVDGEWNGEWGTVPILVLLVLRSRGILVLWNRVSS